jgi:signal transduction histidine kinase
VVVTHTDGRERVSPDITLCLFRIVQEALRNVKKHSGASKAHVQLEHFDGNLQLSITDHGAGF